MEKKFNLYKNSNISKSEQAKDSKNIFRPFQGLCNPFHQKAPSAFELNDANEEEKNKRSSFEASSKEALERIALYEKEGILEKKAIEIFKNTNRSFPENLIFINYLLRLEPFNQIISESAGEEAEDLISNLSFSLKYEFVKKNSFIFKFGEYSEKFYLILNGKVDIIVPNEEEMFLSEEEYFYYLLRLRQFNETNILEKVVSNNFNSFFFEEKSFDHWVKTAFNTLTTLKRPQMRNSQYNVGQYYPKKSGSPNRRRSSVMISSKKRMKSVTSFGELEKKTPKKVVKMTNEVIYEMKNQRQIFDDPHKRNLVRLLESEIVAAMKVIDPSLFPVYRDEVMNKKVITAKEYVTRTKPINFSSSDTHRKKIKVTTYFIANSLSTGDKFGEMMSDSNQSNSMNQRVSTIITSEDCDFGTLDKYGYNKCLKSVSEKMRKTKLNYLLEIDIFKRCNKNLFMKNFCNFFQKKVIYYNEVLFEENTEPSNQIIYLIRDGEFGLFCNKSINEIDKLIVDLGYSQFFQNDDDENLMDVSDYQRFRAKQFLVKIQYSKSNDILGLGDSISKGKYIYTARCTSTQAIVYEIHVNFFRMIVALDLVVAKNVEKFEMIKRNLLVKFLLKTKKSKTSFYSYYDKAGNEPTFGYIRFRKNQKSDLKDLLIKRRNPQKKDKKAKPPIRLLQINCNQDTNYDQDFRLLNSDRLSSSTKTRKKINFSNYFNTMTTDFPSISCLKTSRNEKKDYFDTERTNSKILINQKGKSMMKLSTDCCLLPRRVRGRLDINETRDLINTEIPNFYTFETDRVKKVFDITNKTIFKSKPKIYS